MSHNKPKLLSKEEVANRKQTLDLTLPENGGAPEEGAFIYTCQNGPNAGCRYYAKKSVDNHGNYTSKFISWVDPPKVDLKARVEMQAAEIEALKSTIGCLEKKIKKMKAKKEADDMEDSD